LHQGRDGSLSPSIAQEAMSIELRASQRDEEISGTAGPRIGPHSTNGLL
jgi:hypothetical protein